MDVGLRLSHLESGLTVGQTSGAWCWFRLPSHPWDLLPENERLAWWARNERMLASLGAGRGHLLIAQREMPVDAYLESITAATPRPAAGWSDWLEEQRQHLAGQRLGSREVYLGLQLSRTATRKTVLSSLLGVFDTAAGSSEPAIDDVVLVKLREATRTRLQQILASQPSARIASASELRWLYGRHRPGSEPLPPNEPAEGGELETVTAMDVSRDRQHLIIGGPLTGYRHMAILAADHVPPTVSPGSPAAAWIPTLYRNLEQDAEDRIPVDISIRFRLVPPDQAMRDVHGQVNRAKDQGKHESEIRRDVDSDVTETIQAGGQAVSRMRSGQHGLAYAFPRALVWADSDSAEDVLELRRRITRVQSAGNTAGIRLPHLTAQQLGFLSESYPADRVRGPGNRPDEDGDRMTQSHEQAPEPGRLAASMWGASRDLGDVDPSAPYVGDTISTTGQASSLGGVPVRLSLIAAPVNDQMSTVTLTGPPRGGKTVFKNKMIRLSRLQGADIVDIDLDPTQTERSPLLDMDGLGVRQEILLDHNYPGLLDPWRIEPDPTMAEQLAVELCHAFLPLDLARQVEGALIEAAARETGASRHPSLNGMVRQLENSERGRHAVEPLRAMARWPLSRLCFADQSVEPLQLEGALTVIRFPGLALPARSARQQDYSIQQRLSVGVVRAMAASARKLFAGRRSTPKVLSIDEFWVLAGPTGERLADEAARSSTKTNSSLLVSTQGVADVQFIRRYVGVKAQFRTIDLAEIAEACEFFGVENTREIQTGLQTAKPGECLFCDRSNRVGFVRVVRTGPEVERFQSTPPRQTAIPAWGGAA